MKLYPEIKDSRINWIGEVPGHWIKRSLIHFAQEQQIKNIGLIETNLLSLSYGKIISKDINTTYGLLPVSFEEYQIVHEGNIILRLIDLQNDHKSLRTALVTQTGIITSAYICLQTRGEILPQYLHLILRVADLRKVFYAMGGGVRQSIGFEDIRSLIIVQPPLSEQEQIVRFLDWKSSEIDQLISLRKKQISVLEELKKALISRTVTKGIDPNIPMKYSGVSWIKEIPEHWECKRGRREFVSKKFKNDRNIEKNVLSLTLGGVIRNNSNNPIGLSPASYATYQIFEKNDLVFKLIDLNNISTSRVGLVPERGIMSSAYIRLIARNKCSIKFFYLYYFYLWLRNVYNGLGTGVRPNLTAKDLLNIEIVVPPFPEQEQIANFLDRKSTEIDQLISLRKKQIAVLEELKTRIISDVVTGKIDVRNIEIPEYEVIDDELEEEIMDEGEEESEELEY